MPKYNLNFLILITLNDLLTKLFNITVVETSGKPFTNNISHFN